jgi:hypothetical protein
VITFCDGPATLGWAYGCISVICDYTRYPERTRFAEIPTRRSLQRTRHRQSAIALLRGWRNMDKGDDQSFEAPPKRRNHPGLETGARPMLLVLSYAVVMGVVATALGAVAASGTAGRTKIVVWVAVTTVLTVGAVGVADSVIVALFKRRRRSGHYPVRVSQVAISTRRTLEAHNKAASDQQGRSAADSNLREHRRLVQPDVAERRQ